MCFAVVSAFLPTEETAPVAVSRRRARARRPLSGGRVALGVDADVVVHLR